MQAVILAGGLATRMRPRTLTTPKSMLEVGGRPFIDWQLERLAAAGYDDVVLCIAHLGETIRAHVGDGGRFGVKARYSDEGQELLGTAGALVHALDLLAPCFLVTYGDSYLPFDYASPLRLLEASHDCDGVMSVYRNQGRWDASNVETDGAWVLRYEKGAGDAALDHIDYGATALRRAVIARLPRSPLGLDRVQHELAAAHRMRAVVALQRFFEIGSEEGLAELGHYLDSQPGGDPMIVSRAPVRFSLGGGGTDLPSYSREHGGFIVAAAVDKYVFVCAARRFYDSIRLAYSKTEIVDSIDQIEHRIYREALRFAGITKGIELQSLADVPANSGLGSSSAFTVAVLNALHAYRQEFVPIDQLAREACHIEIDILKEPIGKQDQFISAYGGITAFTFHKDGSVDVERVPVREEVLDDLESSLVVFYSGIERAASVVLADQGTRISGNQDGAVERMHRIKALGHETRRILLAGTLDQYGELLHEHWTQKRNLASKMTDPVIDEHYEAARKAGALGGKLMGAGGGGFFLFYVRAPDKRKLYEAMVQRGLKPLRFRFDFHGARIVANLDRS